MTKKKTISAQSLGRFYAEESFEGSGIWRVKDPDGNWVEKNGVIMGFAVKHKAEHEASLRNIEQFDTELDRQIGEIQELEFDKAAHDFEDLEDDVHADRE